MYFLKNCSVSVYLFLGRECKKWLEVFGSALRIVHKALPSDNGQDINGDASAAWEAFITMWNLVQAPLERRSAETMAERNARWAELFQNAANTYVEALVRATSSLEVAGHIYAHLFTAHFPALIRKYGDLRPYSGESTEALDKIQKR